MGWMPAPDGIAMCQGDVVLKRHEEEKASMEEVTIVGFDLAKRVFQLHGARSDGSRQADSLAEILSIGFRPS